MEEEEVLKELRALRNHEVVAASIPPEAEIKRQIQTFQRLFGPEILRSLDGLSLLQLMHARSGDKPRCMAYCMEYKNDDDFSSPLFGGIGGGSALKFGIYQDPKSGAWISGSSRSLKEITEDQAIKIARGQRDELIAGSDVLRTFEGQIFLNDSDAQALQTKMEIAAPNLVGSGWAHKYWSLSHPELVDGYHSPKLQRFHLIKLLQMPPDEIGTLDASAPRFTCTSRYLELAHRLDVSLTTLSRILNKRDGAQQSYWKIGTTEGSTGDSFWPVMHSGNYVSIGWANEVGDLSEIIGRKTAKDEIKQLLFPVYEDAKTASRKAGEILNFAKEIAEKDLVLATDGQTVLGVGRITGPYRYQPGLTFPHIRPVQWLLLEKWKLPELEAPRTTVAELGKYPRNLLELEQKLQNPESRELPRSLQATAETPLADLDFFNTNLLSILARKGQAILYGPPGTGKTYRALQAANEFAARKTFRKSFSGLSATEKLEITSDNGLVRICTFHPGWGYEDFMEGLKPTTVNGNLIFEPRDGAFKQLCIDAEANQQSDYFLIIDEINRGDLPRIFGELITIIEMDKREKRILLPVTATQFQIPKNVFIIGTMNTADRSVTLLDSALRRRFGFMEMMPDSSHLKSLRIGDFQLGPWLDALNTRIREHLKRDARDLQVGHAYLLPPTPITSVAEFSRILRYDIIPLLQDYCFDDFETLREILGNRIVDVENACISEELFEPNRGADLIAEISYPQMDGFVILASAQANGIDSSDEIDDVDTVEIDNVDAEE